MNRFWLAAQVCLLGFVGTAFASPFQNGGFELGTPTADPCNISLPIGSTAITGWTVVSGDIDYVTTCWTSSQGARSLDLVGTGSIGGIQQTFDTVSGATYQVSFDLAGNYGLAPVVKPLNVTVAAVNNNYTFDTTGKSAGNMGWVTRTFVFTANASTSTIRFVSDLGGSGTFAGAALDNVSVVRTFAATTTGLFSTPNPSVTGSSVTFTVQVQGTVNSPTGTVDFTNGGSPIAGCTGVPLGPTGSPTIATAECVTASLTAGGHEIIASYSGDVLNGASNNALVQTVNPPVVVAPTAWTGFAGSVTNQGVPIGSLPSVVIDGTRSIPTAVSDGTTGPAVFTYETINTYCCHTGDWTFQTTANGAGDVGLNWTYSGYHGTCQAQASLTAFIRRNGVVIYSAPLYGAADDCANNLLPAGGFAVYGPVVFAAVQIGDTYGFTMHASNYDSNGGVQGRLTVTTGTTPTTTTVAASANPVLYGASVQLTAHVANSGFDYVSGTVSFTQEGRIISGCDAVPLLGNGSAACWANLPQLPRNIVALYTGDATNAGSVSSALLVNVNAGPPPASFTVNSAADAVDLSPGDGICADSQGRCTLRAAAMEAGAFSGATTIIVPPGTYVLGLGVIDVSGNVTMSGAGAVNTIVDGGALDRVFMVNAGVVTISGLTVRNGHIPDDVGPGAGIANFASLTLNAVTVSGNTSDRDGGGIFNSGTLLAVSDSTIADNVAGAGAGIYSIDSKFTMRNSTVSHNHSIGIGFCGDGGAGMYFPGVGQATITNSTIFANIAECTAGQEGRGHAIASWGATTTIRNSILASPNLGGNVCFGGAYDPAYGVTSLGHNLVGDNSCGAVATDLIFPDPQLYPLGNYGATPTHELLLGSPARDAVPIADCATAKDQEGNTRPMGPACDIGAVESAPLPTLAPTTTTLASAPNPAVVGAGVTFTATVTTTVSGSDPTGFVDIFYAGGPTLDPGCLGLPLTGTGDSRTAACTTSILPPGSWLVSATYNGNLTNQSSSGQTTQAINAAVPPLAAPTLVLVVATSSNQAAVIGRADGVPNGSVTFNVYSGSSCNAGALVGGNSVGTFTVPTDDTGVFGVSVANVNSGDFVAVQLTSPSTSPMSACAASSGDNDFWPKALQVVDGGSSPRDFIDASGKSRWYKFSVTPGQKITVTLSGLADYDLAVFKDINKAFVEQLVPNGTAALTKLSAEFAPSTFSPSTFSPSTFSPSTFSPDAYAPSTFSPSTFSPSLYSPSTFSPSTFSPSTFSPSTFSPSTFSPSTFSPSTFSPSTFSPSTFSPATVLSLSQTEVAQAFSSAQTRSLVAVSATPGTGNESAAVNTWNDTGDFYVRVTGRGGAFSTSGEFTLNVAKGATTCGLVTNPPSGIGSASHPAVIGPSGRQSIILTDSTLVAGDPAALLAKLAALAGNAGVAGVVVDLKNDARVLAYRAQAVAHADCPYASNLLAQEIKGVVDQYRAANPGLRYVVIAGNDSVVPYFRYPDESLLGEESAYVPPVRNGSASDASLTQDFVLSQDAYGSSTSISMRGIDFPIPGLAVGRLVETSTEMGAVIDAFLGLANGSVVPGTSLVTGYDFLADAAGAVSTELQTGTGAVPQALIAANGVSPQSASSWTATQLKSALLGSRHDVIFLAGHFSANSALAADFTTSMLTTDLAASTTDFRNTIVFSAGCHSGYNIVDSDAIDGVTLKLDWPQAFAQKGATLVAGTGYQYGDTEFIEYSERLYQNFARQLRAGTSGSAVTVGEALVRAKLDYLAATPEIRGIHQKALLEATVFGLPMLGVNMPTGRDPNAATPGVIDTSLPSTLAAGPAGTLGLRIAPLSFAPSLSPSSLCLKNPPYDAGSPGVPPPPCSAAYTTASWLTGPNGVTSNPAEPVLPLQIVNVTPTTAVVLRGVGFVGGSYTESTVVPLTGAPTTELRGVHTPFLSPVFFPMRLSTPNYFGALSGSGGTKLLVTPVQHRAADVAAGTSTRRAFTNLDLRLYYSGNTTTTALSAAPTIVGVTAVTDNSGVTFSAQVIGDPAAAIHDVWVTYTSDGSGTWTSLSLAQCSATSPPAACGTTTDSQRWMAHLPPQTATLKYIVQAVNGIGLVSADDNLGAYYSAGGTSGQTLPEGGTTAVATTLTLGSSLGGATYGDTIPVTATLSAGTTPTAGKIVTFTLGSASQSGVTNASGSVTINLPVSTLPGGNFLLKASFAGDQDLVTSSATSGAITVNKASSSLASLAPLGATLTGTIGGKSQPIDGSVKFTLTSPTRGATTVWAVADYLGRATLPPPGMLAGVYMVTSASFAGNAIYQPATLTLAQTITVPKANQTITFGPVSPKTAGDPNFTIAATATSLLPVSFVASGACTISGATVHLTGVGSCTITGSVAATNDFNAATGVLSFSILPAGTATVLTADKTSPVSFGTTINLTATMTPATATGTVTFLDGSTTLGTATAPAAGTTAKAVFAVSSLSIGAHSLTAVYAGNVSLAGSTSAPLSIVIKESFTVANPMLQPRVSHTATLLNDGRVLIAGGSGSGDDDTRASRTAEIYCPNPYTPPAAPVRTLAQWCPNGVGKFSQAGRGNTNQVGIGNLVQARTYHTATLLPNGTVLLVGGYDGSGVSSATAEIYDPTDPIADKFTAAASLPGNAAAGHTATVVTKSGKTYVLVIGGGSAKSWLFDVVAKTWAASGNMASVRSNHTATLIGTKVFVAGGALLLQSLQSTAIYDIATGTFANGPTMLAARELHTATPIANGKVLLAGGRGGGLVNSVALTPLAEIYDPANAATPFVASTLASGTGRFGHSASALSTVGGLPDGRVLVAGGGINILCGQQLATSELYAAGSFTVNATLAAKRVRHTATVLKDGRVLIAGGRGTSGNNCGPLNTTEIWTGQLSP